MNDLKPYELTFDNREQYLLANIKADAIDVPTALEYWQTIIDKCRELKADKLLVHQEIANGLNTADTFTVACAIAAMDSVGIKLAFVDPIPSNYEQHQFGELVAGNRGLWARVFTTVPEARNWLQRSGSQL